MKNWQKNDELKTLDHHEQEKTATSTHFPHFLSDVLCGAHMIATRLRVNNKKSRLSTLTNGKQGKSRNGNNKQIALKETF